MLCCTAPSARAAEVAGRRPVIVLETVKGTIEFETYPEEAPKTVARIVELVKKNFYNGLRFHRAEPNFVIQVGDPQIARHDAGSDWWGTRRQRQADRRRRRSRRSAGTCAARWRWRTPASAKDADSQFFIMLRAAPELDGKYTVFGQVINGHGRRREDSEGRRAQEGFGEGMSGGRIFTMPFRSG